MYILTFINTLHTIHIIFLYIHVHKYKLMYTYIHMYIYIHLSVCTSICYIQILKYINRSMQVYTNTSNKKIPSVMKCDIELINTKKEQEQDYEF